jgi:hypothetical protein
MAVPAPIVYIDGDGVRKTANAPLLPGRAPAAEARPVALSNEDAAFLDGLETKLDSLATKLDTLNTAVASTAPALIAQADEYETVAASQTDQVLGATGAAGDRIAGFLINPATTSPGTVTLKDGSTVIYTFTGGASSVSNLDTIPVPLGIKSVSGAFKITTGANVSVIAVGDFT